MKRLMKCYKTLSFYRNATETLAYKISFLVLMLGVPALASRLLLN